MGILADFQFDPQFSSGLFLGREPQAQMPALDLEEDNNTTTRLLTLLNVSALKSSKRKRIESVDPVPRIKLNRRRSIDAAEPFVAPKEAEGKPETAPADATAIEDTVTTVEDAEDDQGTCGLFYHEPSFN